MSGKRTYQKPVVTRVELRPEEAVLAACKTGVTATKTNCSGASKGACTNVTGS